MPVTDVIAQPAAQAASEQSQQVYLWMGGIFDVMIGGLPIYFWIMFLGVIAFIGVLFFDWYRWDAIKAVSGHFDSVRKGIPEAIKITKNMKMKLVPAKYADQIFEWEDPTEIEKWQLTAPHSVGQLGPVNTAILVDFHDWVDNPLINESIKVAAETWNEANPDDQIHHYDKYMLYRRNGKLKALMPNGIEVPSYFWVDWSKQEQYMPYQRDAASLGGYLLHEAKEYDPGNNEEKKNYGTYILGGCVIIGIVIIIFSYLAGHQL